MPIPASAFRYVPGLKGKIIQPEDSHMRLSQADIDAVDDDALKQGRPKPSITPQARDASRKAVRASAA